MGSISQTRMSRGDASKAYYTFIVISIVFTLTKYCQACPNDEICYCTKGDEIHCAKMNLRTVPYFYAENKTYEFIDLGRNKIKRLSAKSFMYLRVKKIKIWQNAVEVDVHKKAFRGLEDHLEALYLRRSHIRTLPPALFRRMKKLWSVDLSGNRITRIPRGIFQGASSIQSLDLMHNDIEFLDTGVFTGLKNLLILKMGDNRIQYLDPAAFSGLHSLEELLLTDNFIRDLQPHSFKKLRKLKKLDLSGNEIPAVFPLMFEGMNTVEELFLNDNPLCIIFDNAFGAMRNLKELFLARTHLKWLKRGMFHGLNKLEILHLHHNGITNLRDGVFQHLSNLKELQLDNNNLRNINACAFKDANKLNLISALMNPIECACSMKWTSAGKGPEIRARCAEPSKLRRRDVSRADNYERCKKSDSKVKCQKKTREANRTERDSNNIVFNS